MEAGSICTHVHIFEKGNRALVVNYIAMSILNNFFKISGSMLHYQFFFSNYKSKLRPAQRCVLK
jgi:hypothetical protein